MSATASVSNLSTFCARCASFSSMGFLLPRQAPPPNGRVVAASAPGAQAVAAVAIRREGLGGLGVSAVTAALHRKVFCRGARGLLRDESRCVDLSVADPPPGSILTRRPPSTPWLQAVPT